jgi:hypothetical protein
MSLVVRVLRAVRWRVIAAIAAAGGMDVVERGYASPIPDPALLPPSTWGARSEFRGVRFDLDAQMELLRTQLGPYLSEFTPPIEPTGRGSDYYLHNRMYGPVDAEVLYAMIRSVKPKRLIETGSGFSSKVIGAALAANAADGHDCKYQIFDPYPGESSAEAAPLGMLSAPELRKVSATDVPVSEYAQLGAGDILFADTSHTVKTGGEVNYLLLDVLPALAPGVIVHIHDIYLPWEYPRDWIERFRYYWAEQYLLHAFLVFNDQYEVIFSSWGAVHEHGDELARLIPSFVPFDYRDGPPMGDSAWHHPVPERSAAKRLRDRLRHGVPSTSEPSAIWLRRREP